MRIKKFWFLAWIMTMIPFLGYGQKVIISSGHPIFYIGYKNLMDFCIDGYSLKQVVKIKVTGGYFFKERENYYVVPDTTRTLSIRFKIRNKDGKSFWTEPVNISTRHLPSPESLFGTRGTNNIISIGELKTVTSMNVGIGDGFAPAFIHYKVQSYDIAIISPGMMFFRHVSGNLLTDEIRRKVRNLGGGEIIYIYNISTVIRETRFKIAGLRVMIRVKSDYPYRDFIISGYLKKEKKDSLIFLQTSHPSENNFIAALSNKDSVWELLYEGCDHEKPQIREKFKDNTLKWSGIFDDDGKLYTEEKYDRVITHWDYGRNNEPVRIYNYLPDKGITDYELLTADSIILKETWESWPSITEYGSVKHCLIGKWQSFYEGGRLKEEGNFDTISRKVSDTSLYNNPYDPYNPETISVYYITMSAKNGPWHYYAPDGKLIKTINYQMGVPKKE